MWMVYLPATQMISLSLPFLSLGLPAVCYTLWHLCGFWGPRPWSSRLCGKSSNHYTMSPTPIPHFALIVSLVICRRFFTRRELAEGWNQTAFLGGHLYLPCLWHLRPLSTWNALNWSHISRDVFGCSFFSPLSLLSGGWGSLWVDTCVKFLTLGGP